MVIPLLLAATSLGMGGPPPTPDLSTKLPTPATVTCTQNTNESYAVIADKAIFLSRDECAVLSRPPSLNGDGWISWASAAQVLYHEWWHVATGETDEKKTDIGSLVVYRYMLRTYWGMSAALAQRYYMQAVGTTHYGPLAYRATKTDPLLTG